MSKQKDNTPESFEDFDGMTLEKFREHAKKVNDVLADIDKITGHVGNHGCHGHHHCCCHAHVHYYSYPSYTVTSGAAGGGSTYMIGGGGAGGNFSASNLGYNTKP